MRALLEARFPELAGRVLEPRPRRAFVDVPQESFAEVLRVACDELGFGRLITIVGMDDVDALSALYMLGRDDGAVLGVRLRVPRERPVVPTVTGRFPGGESYERELIDLLGFEVAGLPPGRRYPLPADWPPGETPLRKDWKPGPRAGRAGS